MKRNIVLLILDTVRKDFFDDNASRLTERSSISFHQCRASSSWSVPSHASILTGELPSVHGVNTHNPKFSIIEETFLNELSNYEHYGVSANFYASSAFDFDNFFDRFVEVAPHQRFIDGLNLKKFSAEFNKYGLRFYLSFLRRALHHDRPLRSIANGLFFKLSNISTGKRFPKLTDGGAKSVCKSAQDLVSNGSEPFFLFMNVMDAHGPHEHTIHYNRELHSANLRWHSSDFDNWEVNTNEGISGHEDDIKNHRELYAAAIDYLDRQLETFITQVSSMTDNPTTFIITSDHGENMGYEEDDFLVNHTSSLSEGILHVPCEIINPPIDATVEESSYFSHTSLADLITDLAKGEYHPHINDSAAAEVIGISGNPDADIDMDYWDRAIRAVYKKQSKVVWDSLGDIQWYNLNYESPCWQRKSAHRTDIPDWAHDFFVNEIEFIKSESKQNVIGTDFDEIAKERLEELGYM